MLEYSESPSQCKQCLCKKSQETQRVPCEDKDTQGECQVSRKVALGNEEAFRIKHQVGYQGHLLPVSLGLKERDLDLS